KVNEAVLHEAIVMYRANKRVGAASTKRRSEVSGGGIKPWRQKGTGRARTGSIRSPIFRGGGSIFGPKPRDYSYSIPKKIKRKALLSSINSKLNDGNIIIVEEIKLDKIKTREFVDIFKALKLAEDKVLLVVEKVENNLRKSAGNVKNITVKNADNFNTYDVLANKKMVVTEKSLELINKRVSL
ncbi:MAG: 50S ribosomal protein L4, partial [Candidatus Omnitrophica bacterium]|nr:50S ribosomal protein L4 [Candidatus Omnitrophota bacterium]